MGGDTNRYRSTKPNADAKASSERSGQTVDAGPYVATVVGHVKGSRLGQLKVMVPDWQGDDIIPDDGITVTYASPFYGTTFGTDTQLNPNTPATSGQSYGFWAVPPDIGNKVLVCFAKGDLMEGYWFACVYNRPSHHMVPGIARSVGGADSTLAPADAVGARLSGDSNIPVQEFDTSDPNWTKSDGLVNTKRYPHEFQTMQLINQGLDKDKQRGALSSSSLRESPSNVFGMSTPGPKGTKEDQSSTNPDIVYMRKGGHQFVMDDGDKDGNDQLIRLRTSGGHQILMRDDSKYTTPDGETVNSGIMYISSASGNQWLEFSADGSINIFGSGGINMRSYGPINMHSDTLVSIQGAAVNITAASSGSPNVPSSGFSGLGNNVTINSSGSVAIAAVTTAAIKSSMMLNLSACGSVSIASDGATSVSGLTRLNLNGATIGLNSPFLPIPALPKLVIPQMGHPESVFDKGSSTWQIQEGALQSACSVVPAHEPWVGSDWTSRPDRSKGAGVLAGIISGLL